VDNISTVDAVMDDRVHVCPLSQVPTTLAQTRARHIITVINAQTMPETPNGIEAANHLRLGMNDIICPQHGLVHPTIEHVAEIARFASMWNRSGPLLIHCWAGISRSTAAAFITLCAVNPDAPEILVAQRLREASATAMPNRLMVSLADEVLGRHGRMLKAVADIGPGRAAAEAEPFAIASRFP
jgi:predicted protein tyrosine phosphatase